MDFRKAFSVLLCIIFISSSAMAGEVFRASAAAKPVDPADCVGLLRRSDTSELELGHWNMENAFDIYDDTEKEDKEFLPDSLRPTVPPDTKPHTGKPKINWNRERFAVKLGQIQRMVNKGMGRPPVLSGVEIESSFTAQMIARALGYQFFRITHSIDGRGVNVATFFDEMEGFVLQRHGEIPLTGEMFATHPTRSIQEMEFLINGRHQLFLHNNHWPSQMGPPEAREAAAMALWSRLVMLKRRYPNAYFISTGDFNVVDTVHEHPHAIRFLEEDRPGMPRLVDLHRYLLEKKKLPADFPKGTYFYDKTEEWNVLDRWLVSPELLDPKAKTGLVIDPASYQIIVQKWATAKYTSRDGTKTEIIPAKYDHSSLDPKEAGFSDHFPIVLKLIDLDEKAAMAAKAKPAAK